MEESFTEIYNIIYTGSKILDLNPPNLDFSNLISPPWDLIISLVIDNPNPLSPFSLLRDGSSVKKGLNTSS